MIRWFIGVFVLLLAASLGGACETDGVTPNCPGDMSSCITPPGDSAGAPDAATD